MSNMLYMNFLLFFWSPPGEIDRCLKKVAEGVEQFEDIWQKVRNNHIIGTATFCFHFDSKISCNGVMVGMRGIIAF